MPVQSEHVQRYLHDLRPQRSPVMQEMEQFAEREAVPIVHWETGRFLATLVRALDPAAGARGRDRDRLLVAAHGARRSATGRSSRSSATRSASARRPSSTPARASRTRSRSWRATRSRRSTGSTGPFDLIFLDGTKIEYPRYLELVEPKAAERAVLVVDNMLMSGDVALEDDSEARWTAGEPRDGARVQPPGGALRAVARARCCRSATASCSRRAVSRTPATAPTIVSTACS